MQRHISIINNSTIYNKLEVYTIFRLISNLSVYRNIIYILNNQFFKRFIYVIRKLRIEEGNKKLYDIGVKLSM